MTHTYHYLKCTYCGTCLLIDAERCWYCTGDEFEEHTVEWVEPDPIS